MVAIIAASVSCFSLVTNVARCIASDVNNNKAVVVLPPLALASRSVVRLPTRLKASTPSAQRSLSPRLASFPSNRDVRVEMGKLQRTLSVPLAVDINYDPQESSDFESGSSTSGSSRRSKSRRRTRPHFPVHAPASPLASAFDRLTPRTPQIHGRVKSIISLKDVEHSKRQRSTSHHGSSKSHSQAKSALSTQELEHSQRFTPRSLQRHTPRSPPTHVRTRSLLSIQELERSKSRAKHMRTITSISSARSSTLHSIQEEQHFNDRSLQRANSDDTLTLERDHELVRCLSTKSKRRRRRGSHGPSRLSPHLVASKRPSHASDSERESGRNEELDTVRLHSLRTRSLAKRGALPRFNSLRNVFTHSPSTSNDTLSSSSTSSLRFTSTALRRSLLSPANSVAASTDAASSVVTTSIDSVTSSDGAASTNPSYSDKNDSVSLPSVTYTSSCDASVTVANMPTRPSLRRQRSKSSDFAQMRKPSTKSEPDKSQQHQPHSRSRSLSDLTESLTKAMMRNAAMRLTGFFSLVDNLRIPSIDPIQRRNSYSESISESIKIVRRLSKSLSQSRRSSSSEKAAKNRRQSMSTPKTPPTIHESSHGSQDFPTDKCLAQNHTRKSIQPQTTSPRAISSSQQRPPVSYNDTTAKSSTLASFSGKRLSRAEALKAIQALNATLSGSSKKLEEFAAAEGALPSPPPPVLVKRLSSRDALRMTDALNGNHSNAAGDQINIATSSHDTNCFSVEKRRVLSPHHKRITPNRDFNDNLSESSRVTAS